MRRWLLRPVPFWMWLATCVVLGVLFATATVFVTNSAIESHDAKVSAARQQEGRAVAIDVLCGFGNGVAEAGRKALAGDLQGQGSMPGLPEIAQRDYVRTIDLGLLTVAGVGAGGVLTRTGSVDCRKLRLAARAPHKAQ